MGPRQVGRGRVAVRMCSRILLPVLILFPPSLSSVSMRLAVLVSLAELLIVLTFIALLLLLEALVRAMVVIGLLLYVLIAE
ncbi:hypothetical protein AV530_014015 [Patagioenas fasciata monilis]|uniref:Uncharacterized protein n=1 Tax=Patagioenas fasciata monilis TaxID=372326 RepID=A0A1V4JT73_PATFA|nr:hypothetical protein AV530_014015 [Patagioenas fasciata monilis]